jgi:hypothetical protein
VQIVKNKETANGPNVSGLATLSADELACVAGGRDEPVLVVEDGKEQYPGKFPALKKGHGKKHH